MVNAEASYARHVRVRLTLNILPLAQFERENLRERTPNKQFASHRKGQWTGGRRIFSGNAERLEVQKTFLTSVRPAF